MRDSRTASRKIALCAMLMALAMIFSYVEVLIPINLGVPGIKLGIANLVVVVGLFFLPAGEVLMISVARILLRGYLFGNVMSILYSLAGGLLSFLVMLLLKHIKGFSITGVSIAGGVTHNVAQICVAALVVQNRKLFYYLPALLVAGVITGMLIAAGDLKSIVCSRCSLNLHSFCGKTRGTKEFFAVKTPYLRNFFCVGTKIIPQTSQYRIIK